MSVHSDDMELPMPDGGSIVLHQTVGVPKRVWLDPTRNVFRYSKSKERVWIISPAKHIEGEMRSSTYTWVGRNPDGSIQVNAFDGCIYQLDGETGMATFVEWEK